MQQSARGYANYQEWIANTQLEQRVSLEDYSVSNRGLRAGLVGTPEQVAERILEFEEAGVDLLLLQFSPQHEEMERFAEEVMPLVRSRQGLSARASAEQRRYLLDVVPRLLERRDAAVLFHVARARRCSWRARACTLPRWEFSNCSQVTRAGHDVLTRIHRVVGAKLFGDGRHQLHQAQRADRRNRHRVERGLGAA